MTQPLDQFWVLTDDQAGGHVAYLAVAYSRTHTQADGKTFVAISPTFKTAAEMKSHITMMIDDLKIAFGTIDAAFRKKSH